MTLPAITSAEARLILDHLDNVQASSLPARTYVLYCSAKYKLAAIEATNNTLYNTDNNTSLRVAA